MNSGVGSGTHGQPASIRSIRDRHLSYLNCNFSSKAYDNDY